MRGSSRRLPDGRGADRGRSGRRKRDL